ncbi:MAG TPA: hypothetical protein VNG33_10110 [Polyangiaceae bacterium]|nr:hypothetical protein [Polyangiaceae bacterium]
MDLTKFLIDQGGIWGLIAAALSGALMYKERESQRLRAQIDAEHLARLNDAKENTRALLSIAEQTHEALDKLQSLAPPPRR